MAGSPHHGQSAVLAHFSSGPDGVRRRFKKSTGPNVSQKEALTLGRQWKNQADSLGYVADFVDAEEVFNNEQNAERPFSGYAWRWFHDEQGRWKRSEIRAKESIIRVHLYPFFKHADMRTILPGDIERFVTLKRKEGKSPKTINNILSVLKGIFRSALLNEVVTRNAAAEVKLLKVQKPTYRFYDEPQTEAFLDLARKHEPARTKIDNTSDNGALRDISTGYLDYRMAEFFGVFRAFSVPLGAKMVPMVPRAPGGRRSPTSQYVFGPKNLARDVPSLLCPGLPSRHANAGRKVNHVAVEKLQHLGGSTAGPRSARAVVCGLRGSAPPPTNGCQSPTSSGTVTVGGSVRFLEYSMKSKSQKGAA